MSISLDAGARRNFGSASDAVVDDFEDLFALSASEREAGRANPFGTEAAFLNGEFNVLNELDVDVQVKQR